VGSGTPNGGLAKVIDAALGFAALLLAGVASLGFVAFVGGVILWSRFEAAQLAA
jgi:hypothetical protein